MNREKDNSYIAPLDIMNMVNEKDDLWHIKSPQGKIHSFSFSKLNDSLKRDFKEYIYHSVCDIKGNKLTTIYKDYIIIREFLLYIQKDIDTLVDLMSYHFINYIDEIETDESDKDIRKILLTFKKYFYYYEYKMSKFALEELERLNDKYINMKSKSSSFHLIPQEYFDTFISLMIKDRDNPNLSYEERAYACLGIIQSQIGVRKSELYNLERQGIIGQPDINIGNKFIYRIFKTASKGEESFNCTSFLNPIALKSWAMLNKICITKFGSQSHFLFDIKKNKFKDLQDYFIKFSLKHHKQLSSINNLWYNSFMHTVKLKTILKDIPEELNADDDLCYPIIHQFRVYRIHTLVSKGVPINEIAKTVGHKENQMTFEYCRNVEEGYQELRKNKFGYYSKEMLGILSDLAKQQNITLDEYVNHKVPNGTCTKPYCERRENVINNFKN